MAVKPVPDGHHTVTPYLIVHAAGKLIDFVRQAFDATVAHRMDRPDGTVGHAEVRIGDSFVMIADARPEWPAMPTTLHLYLPDADEAFRKAVAAGAEPVQEVATQFYGDRSGGVKDPCGNYWWVSTHVEDVPPEEIARRAAALGR